MLQLQLPNDLNPDDFLQTYWQRRPLLMRGAFPAITNPVPADILAGLACEEEIESRLVIEQGSKPWEVRQGPFDEADFAALPDSHWTLLVQDVDKHLASAAELLGIFGFLPRWRMDDVMVSYAADQGSVGPHTDAYDVFLVQTEGQRRWRISTAAITEDDLLPDTDIKILKNFEAEQEWLLSPGDVLYLPPGVAHWGVAEGPCVTCSVGFRSPNGQELAADWCEQVVSEASEQQRYTDPPLHSDQPGGEISRGAVAQAVQLLEAALQCDATAQARWFGRLMTEPKPHHWIEPATQRLDTDQLSTYLQQGGALFRHPYARLAYTRTDEQQLVIFADGHDFTAPATLLAATQELTTLGPLQRVDAAAWLDSPAGMALLVELYNQGSLVDAEDA